MITRMIFLSLVLFLMISEMTDARVTLGKIAGRSREVLAVDSQTKPNNLTSLNFRNTITTDLNRNESPIKFELHPHLLAENGGSYREGGPVSLRCAFVNTSSRRQKILLADHNDYSGTLPFPIGLLARVWDSSGELITKNDLSPDGWWSWSYNSSAVFFERPGDTITLRPKEKVTRIVPLEAVLRGCKTLPEGLKPGRYSVQLKLGDLVSNKIEITINNK